MFAAAEGERWVFPGSAGASGGCPELFRLEDEGEELVVQSRTSPLKE